MMTMKNTGLILLSVLMLVGVALIPSCKKPDEEKPTLILEKPMEGQIFDSGTTMHVEGIAKDNVGLSQLKIDIHDAFDGHTHGRLSGSATAFSVVRIVNLKGKEFKFHEDIDIPLNTLAGEYHVTVSVVDEAGNLSDVVERDIIIRNSTDLIPPVIEIIEPVNAQVVPLNGSLLIRATISDNEELEEVKIKIKNASGSKVYEWKADHLHVATYELNHTANLTGLPAGAYKLEVEALDHVNNKTKAEVNFVIQ